MKPLTGPRAHRNLAVLSWQAAVIAAGYRVVHYAPPKWIKVTPEIIPELQIIWREILLDSLTQHHVNYTEITLA